jgi:hypothetical protein
MYGCTTSTVRGGCMGSECPIQCPSSRRGGRPSAAAMTPRGTMLLAPLVSALAAAAASDQQPPHLIYVLTDNLGWCVCTRRRRELCRGSHFSSRTGWVWYRGNVGYHRASSSTGPSPEVVTPNIDELVRTGVVRTWPSSSCCSSCSSSSSSSSSSSGGPPG